MRRVDFWSISIRKWRFIINILSSLLLDCRTFVYKVARFQYVSMVINRSGHLVFLQKLPKKKSKGDRVPKQIPSGR